jgi:hypothetical protein
MRFGTGLPHDHGLSTYWWWVGNHSGNFENAEPDGIAVGESRSILLLLLLYRHQPMNRHRTIHRRQFVEAKGSVRDTSSDGRT